MDGFKLLEMLKSEMNIPIVGKDCLINLFIFPHFYVLCESHCLKLLCGDDEINTAMSKEVSTDTVMRTLSMGACFYLAKPLRKEDVTVIWQHVVLKNRNDNKSITGEQNCGRSSGHVRNSTNNEIVSINKPRMVWTVELHKLFVEVVNEIGLKGILTIHYYYYYYS